MEYGQSMHKNWRVDFPNRLVKNAFVQYMVNDRYNRDKKRSYYT